LLFLLISARFPLTLIALHRHTGTRFARLRIGYFDDGPFSMHDPATGYRNPQKVTKKMLKKWIKQGELPAPDSPALRICKHQSLSNWEMLYSCQ
jgi:hypothetical protein